MRRLVFNLIKTFHMTYVVMTYSVNNPNTSGFTFLHNFLS
jgi:hypothetical protein